MAFADEQVLPYVCKLDKASRGAGYALRFCPTAEQKLLLMMGAQPLCSKDFLESEFASCEYNRGEVFERLVTEKFGQVWVKDSIPFTEAGDIEVDGIAYQIKYLLENDVAAGTPDGVPGRGCARLGRA